MQLRILKELLVNVILEIPSIRTAQRLPKFVADAVVTPIKQRRQDDLGDKKSGSRGRRSLDMSLPGKNILKKQRLVQHKSARLTRAFERQDFGAHQRKHCLACQTRREFGYPCFL
jgi:hypothetical protein